MSRQRAGTSLADKAKAKAEVIKKREEIQREKNKVSGSAADKVMRERKGIAEQPAYGKKAETAPKQPSETNKKINTDQMVSDNLVSVDLESVHSILSTTATSSSPSRDADHQIEHTEKPLGGEIITVQLVTDQTISDNTDSDWEDTDNLVTDQSNSDLESTDQTITEKSNSDNSETDKLVTDEINSDNKDSDQFFTDEKNSDLKSTDQTITAQIESDQNDTDKIGSVAQFEGKFGAQTISLLDKLREADLSGGEYKFVFSLIKASNNDWGKGIEMSLIELEVITGGGQSYVVRLLKRLVEKGVLVKKPTPPKAKSNYVLTF